MKTWIRFKRLGLYQTQGVSPVFLPLGLKQRFLILGIGLLSFLCVEPQVHAYIPPSSFILKTWVGKHQHHKKWKTVSSVTLFDSQQNPKEHFKEVTIVTDRQVRSWALNDSDQVLFYQEKPLKDMSVGAQLLVAADGVGLFRALKDQGVPVLEAEDTSEPEQSSLRREGRSVVWVIGEKSVKKDSPQVSFEKDTFFPVRLVLPQRGDSKWTDFSFENFRRDVPWPRVVTAKDPSNSTTLKVQLLEITVQPQELVKTPKVSDPGWTSAKAEVSSEMTRLVQSYYDRLR